MRNFLAKIFGRQKYIDKKEQQEREAYIKSILNFTKPIDDKNRLGQNIEDLAEFDLVGNVGGQKIGGHLRKRFVRLHRGYFPELFNEILRDYPNVNYVTFLDEESIVKCGVAPENFSVLLKQMGLKEMRNRFEERKTMLSETVVPQIMNFFGAKTVYNKPLEKDENYYVLSVDFLKKGQSIFVAEELDKELKIAGHQKIQENLDAIEQKLDLLKTIIKFEMKQKNPKMDIRTIKEDYIYSYLIRTLFLGDRDFTGRNYGFVYDSVNNKVFSAPGFDYELSFVAKPEHTPHFERNLEYIFNNYHAVYYKFKKHLEAFVKIDKTTKKPLYELFIESDVKNPSLAHEMVTFLKETSETILGKCEEIEKKQANQRGN